MNTYGSSPLRILLDAGTRIAAIDGQLATNLGHDTEDLLDAPFSTIVSSADIVAVGAELVQLVKGTETIITSRHKLKSADDTDVEAVLSAEARTGESGFIGFSIAVLVDDDQHSSPVGLPDHLRRLNAPAGLIDADGTIIDTNLAWGQLFATAQAVTPGSDLYTLVHEDDRDTLRARLGELVRGAVSSVRVQQRCLAESGPFWCRMSLAPFDNRARHFTVTAEDISAEHLTNRVLLANEALFRSLAEASPVGLARLAPDLSITYASPSWRRITGERGDKPHLEIASVLHASGRDDALEELRARADESSNEPVLARLSNKSNRPVWASLRIGSVADGELGLIGHVITIEDVTELISASESQGQLAGIVESTSDLVGIADLRTGEILYVNSAAQAHFGLDSTAPGPLEDLYSADAVAQYRSEIYPVLRRGETWTGDLEMIRADGTPVRVRQTVAAEVGADGQPERASVLGRDVSDERQALDELAYKATHDSLTGLPNRSLLVDHMELALARSSREHRPVAVLFIDLDRFKRVNDTYGHDAGDQLLRQLAERMELVLRPSDTVARLAGDEFVVLCEDIDGEMDALTIAERVRTAIEESPVRVGDVELRVSASIGIAMSNSGGSSEPDSLLQRADTAMYRAKTAGRARTELFDDVLRDRAKRRAERTEQLEQAIEDDALDVHYQPIVDLQSGRVVGVEALVRWLHPTAGLLGPSEFLPLATETGLIEDLDALVLARSCRDARHWYTTLGDASPVTHVNIDGSTMLSGALADIIDESQYGSELPPDMLCVELSEPFLMANGDAVVDQMAAIARRDVMVAIDDVGTGAMMLPRLGRFALDILKIDGSLASQVIESEEARQLVRGIVGLGHSLGLRIGAESVEDAEAIPILRELGVDVAQGHVFSAALPAAKVEPLLTLRSTLARADR